MGADLSKAKLRLANLSYTYLPGAIFRDADLRKVDLSWAYLPWADLRGADLSRADLHETDLREADLTDATLSGANLTRTMLDGTVLDGADLSGARLVNVHGLEYEQICAAIVDCDTVYQSRRGGPEQQAVATTPPWSAEEQALLAVCRTTYSRFAANASVAQLAIAAELRRAGFELHPDNEELIARAPTIMALLADHRYVQRIGTGEWAIQRGLWVAADPGR